MSLNLLDDKYQTVDSAMIPVSAAFRQVFTWEFGLRLGESEEIPKLASPALHFEAKNARLAPPSVAI